ncbi:hypothetical protein C121_9 [Stenotrophomonas phage C121]|uniref:hypothetical protein n=1 Tax=Stenotrophomonas phage C121 TaxID=2914029 RepID=UPI00232965E9|nr:hypothetical protein PP752_gp09 [Stenotrophomonas phage C121]UKL14742.1 hypothetical protein C121_9 [Stenotrophomonas phage C121]
MKYIIFAVLALFSFNAAAGITKQDMCESDEALARSIMSARQNGVPIAEVMKIIKDDKWQQYVLLAYEESMFVSEEFKNRAINEYANAAYMVCMKQGK